MSNNTPTPRPDETLSQHPKYREAFDGTVYHSETGQTAHVNGTPLTVKPSGKLGYRN